MKVWLNNLKPGDKFWVCDWEGPREVTIVGSDDDNTFIMSRWKLSDGTSTFVNHHVFTTKEEAINDFIPKLEKQLEILEKKEKYLKTEIDICKEQLNEYRKWVN